MTYRDWRNYGYVSRLECLTCKGPGSSINTGTGITGSQLGVASTAGSQAASEYNQFQSLISPLITQQTALASGDRNAALGAAQPVLSQLSSGFEAAKQRIMNSVPPGAARDKALADLQAQYTTSIGGAQAGLVEQAPTTLANIGSTVGQFGLQSLGAQLNALGGASTTNYNTGQLQAQQEASLLNFFGSLAGAAASPFQIAGKICWIAEALYGVDDPRTLLVRSYLLSDFSRTIPGACAVMVYAIIGRPVAWLAQRSGWLRRALRPLFDRAVERARASHQRLAM